VATNVSWRAREQLVKPDGIACFGDRNGQPLDAATAATLSAIVAKGAMPPLVLVMDDCRAACDRMRTRGVEFTQEPVDRYGTVDAGFCDPSGNGGS
jgi:extradiol dioxygenase family protein